LKRLPYRGGNWNNAAITGVFALNLNNARTNSNANIGARPALEMCPKRPAYRASRQRLSQKDAHSPAKAKARSRKTEQAGRSSSASDRSTLPPNDSEQDMAQTYTNLFEQIYDFERLHAAYRRARLGKRDRMAVLRFEQNLEGELIQLQNELIWDEYRTGRYHRFCIYEPKPREVAALPFRDRVLQHSLVAAIEPIWERRFIADSYACRPGRGMHRGADRAQAMMRRVLREHGQVYALKADISKYFASIDHGVLRQLLRRHIACPRTLVLCDQIIASTAAPDDLAPRGLPIGNLTSQLWANVYLHELDRFAKHELRLKHYVRYMDDFVVLHHDKAALHAIRAQIEAFLWGQLRLRTNAKTQIFPVSSGRGRGLDFLGYHIWPTHRRLRRASIRRIVRSLKRAQRLYAAGAIEIEHVGRSVASWVAHARGADTYRLRRKLLAEFAFCKAGDCSARRSKPPCPRNPHDR